MKLYLRLIVLSVVLVFTTFLSGCATTSLDPYAKFAEAGQLYAKNLNEVFDVAQKTAIDKSSTELIADTSTFDSKAPGAKEEKSKKLNSAWETDKKRIQAFTALRQHVSVVSKYFTQLSALVTTKAVAETAASLEVTANSIDVLSKRLGNESGFKLGDENKEKISKFTEYVIGSRQRATLKKRIQEDQQIIQAALNAHEELLGVIVDDLKDQIQFLSLVQKRMLVVGSFMADTPLMEEPEKAVNWIENRRKLLTTETLVVELADASRATAGSLGKLLTTVVKNETNPIKQIELFKAEIDAIQAVINAFK